MKLVSVNIGKVQTQPWREGTLSALYKQPVKEVVSVGKFGLDGDEQADQKNHGGDDKAVFILPEVNYELFKIKQPFGFLGENLTISGLDETEVCLGDRFQIGNVLLEVTQPRSPCWKLGAQAESQAEWDSMSFLKAYSESGRVGFYCRVLAEGEIETDMSVNWLTRDESQPQAPFRISIKELFLAKQFYQTEAQWSLLQSVIKHPALSSSWQKSINGLLERK